MEVHDIANMASEQDGGERTDESGKEERQQGREDVCSGGEAGGDLYSWKGLGDRLAEDGWPWRRGASPASNLESSDANHF